MRKVCSRCKGQKSVVERIQNLGTREYEHHIVCCDNCEGKGFITNEDLNRYRRSVGISEKQL